MRLNIMIILVINSAETPPSRRATRRVPVYRWLSTGGAISNVFTPRKTRAPRTLTRLPYLDREQILGKNRESRKGKRRRLSASGADKYPVSFSTLARDDLRTLSRTKAEILSLSLVLLAQVEKSGFFVKREKTNSSV